MRRGTISYVVLSVRTCFFNDLQTVIFDCCYFGSGMRNKTDPTRLARGVDFMDWSIPEDIGQSLPPYRAFGRSMHALEKYANGALRSHILLSACGSGERAMEQKRRGLFTTALLKILKDEGVETLTYTELIYKMPDMPMFVYSD